MKKILAAAILAALPFAVSAAPVDFIVGSDITATIDDQYWDGTYVNVPEGSSVPVTVTYTGTTVSALSARDPLNIEVYYLDPANPNDTFAVNMDAPGRYQVINYFSGNSIFWDVFTYPAGPTTPEGAVDEAIIELEELIDTGIITVRTNWLTGRLNQAARFIDRGRTAQALRVLNKILDEIAGQLADGDIDQATADSFSATVQATIDLINAS